MELEPEMLATETIVPVYFAMEDDELLSIYTQTLTSSSSQGDLSAAEGRESLPLDWTQYVYLSPNSMYIYDEKVILFYPDRRDGKCGMDILQVGYF